MDGACRWYGNLRKANSRWRARNLEAIAEYYQADLETPWNQLPEPFRKTLLYGSDGVKFGISNAPPSTRMGITGATSRPRSAGHRLPYQPALPSDEVRIHPQALHVLHEPAAMPQVWW